jgi:recombinational DNA repair protein RecR
MARLIEELKKLPGVGAKSAERFAFHILSAPVLHLQQRHRHRSLRLLRQPHP